MKIINLLCVLLVGVVAAQAGEVIVPVIAWDAHGVGTNRWSTEVYLSNTAPGEALVTVVEALPLRLVSSVPCLPPVAPLVVPGYATRTVSAAELNRYLGCPGQFVGALVLEGPAGLVVSSRMTNHKGSSSSPEMALLQGLSQEIPGLPEEALPRPGVEYMLPALGWHPTPCGSTLLDTYLYLANPGKTPATVTLFDPLGRLERVSLNRQTVALPYQLTLPPQRLSQFLVAPAPEVLPTVCGSPALFDLFFRSDQRVAVMASVVDRTTQDPRTVLPSPLLR